MNIEEIKRNTFIANLSGIAEHFNEQEIKCDTKSNMTATIQLMDDPNVDMVIRFYRKNKTVYSYTEYKENKRHGIANVFHQNGRLRSHSIIDNGNKVASVSFYENGQIHEEKYYYKGKLHGKCKWYINDKIEQIREYKYGTLRYLIYYCNDGKTKETYYDYQGYPTKSIVYDKDGNGTEVQTWHGWY